MEIVFKYIIIILASLIGFYLFSLIVASYCAFAITFSRGSKKKWARDCTDDSPEKKEMYRYGVEWRNAHIEKMTEVSVKNNGLNLYGEYYDFGHKKCVMVLLGRSECFYDAFYFVSPYINKGFNVLVSDSRAHGLSDGKYHTFGFEESRDYLVWAKFLREQYAIEHIVFHGICVGGAAGLFALLSPDCPEYIDGLVVEGMHIRLYETVKNHLLKRKKPLHPTIELMDLWLRLFTSHTMYRGPIDVIGTYEKPLLMLHGKQDKFSRPELAKELFLKCPSTEKTLVYYDEGNHSLLRSHNIEEYDAEIEKFLDRIDTDNITVVG